MWNMVRRNGKDFARLTDAGSRHNEEVFVLSMVERKSVALKIVITTLSKEVCVSGTGQNGKENSVVLILHKSI